MTQVGPETGVRDRRGERKGLANTIPMPIPACGFFFSTLANSLTPNEYPIIQLNSDTVYLEIASDSTV